MWKTQGPDLAAGLERSAINNAVSFWMHLSVTEPREDRHGSSERRENILFVWEILNAASGWFWRTIGSIPEKICTATPLCHSFERMAKDFTLLSPPFSVIAPLCVGGGGGRSHYNRCFMTGLFSFCLFHWEKSFMDAGCLPFMAKNEILAITLSNS